MLSFADVHRTLQMVIRPHEIIPSLDTPFSKYARSNHIASSSELPVIYEIISERRTQISDINMVIRQMEVILDQYREKRQQIQSSMNMHEGLLSCIRRLPSEILEQIFIHCLPPQLHNRPSVRAAPLLLTWICRRWRDIVSNAPSLWRSLVIQRPKEHLLCYDAWLKKAKGYPLSLKFHIPSLVADPHYWKVVTDLLQPHTNRFRYLSVDFDEADGLGMLLSDVPMLERLCISGDIERLTSAEAGPVSIDQSQPFLHTLTIHSGTFDLEGFSAFKPGWENLTRLAMVLSQDQIEIENPIFLPVLHACPNLDHLFFYPVCVVFPYGSAPFTHPKLRVLDILDAELETVSHALMFPNLCHLRIRYSDESTLDSHGFDGGHYDFDQLSLSHIPVLQHLPPEETTHRILNVEIDLLDFEFFTVLNPEWATLTQLVLSTQADGNSSNTFSSLFALCPNLEALVISVSPISGFQHAGSHPILRLLKIELAVGSYSGLLDCLTLPSLRHLDLSLPVDEEWPQASFKEFLSRSQCPIEVLKVKGPRISIKELEEVGSFMPSLRREGHMADVPFYSWSR